VRFFISSSYVDLITYRAAAVDALERLGQTVSRMETFGARPDEPRVACLDEIRRCDAFLGIYAHRYGYFPHSSPASIIEEEYDEATRLSRPRFCFVVAPDFPWRPDMIDVGRGRTRLRALKEKIDQATIRDTFTTPEHLGYLVSTSVGAWLQRRAVADAPPTNPFTARLDAVDDLPSLLYESLKHLRRLTDTDYNQILLVTQADYAQTLVVVADDIGPNKQRYRIAILGGVIGTAFTQGRTIYVPVVHDHANYFQAVLQTRSELATPISVGGIPIGVINSESDETNHFNHLTVRAVNQLNEAIGDCLPRKGWAPDKSLAEIPWVHVPPGEA
jgi:putative methionine-R-sulfoxide reductase with GAF domain